MCAAELYLAASPSRQKQEGLGWDGTSMRWPKRKKKEKKRSGTAAPWIPVWSPTTVLTRRPRGYLRRSNGMRCFLAPMAADGDHPRQLTISPPGERKRAQSVSFLPLCTANACLPATNTYELDRSSVCHLVDRAPPLHHSMPLDGQSLNSCLRL